MNNTIKVAIGAGVALVIGLLVGYAAGYSGKSELTRRVARAETALKESQASVEDQRKAYQQKLDRSKTQHQMQLAKESLLRSLVELFSNNYGLASQQLGLARSHLKRAISGLSGSHAVRANKVFEKVGEVQTLAMRLDPMSRIQIGNLLKEINALSGAR